VIIVDTNVVAYFFIEGPKTRLAQKVRDVDSRWCMPELWRHEFLNALSTHARHGGMSAGQAGTLWRKATELLTGCEVTVDMWSALQLSILHGISAYDAQYIALAEILNVRCVTEDRGLLHVFPQLTCSMNAFCGVD
jgi:predicted nucleic acid-binding protein